MNLVHIIIHHPDHADKLSINSQKNTSIKCVLLANSGFPV